MLSCIIQGLFNLCKTLKFHGIPFPRCQAKAVPTIQGWRRKFHFHMIAKQKRFQIQPSIVEGEKFPWGSHYENKRIKNPMVPMKRLSPESRRKSIQIIYFTAGKHTMERVCKNWSLFSHIPEISSTSRKLL